MIIGRPKFVLASGSPRRLTLINQIGIEPDALRPADIDEMPLRGELPRACANRLARGKAGGYAAQGLAGSFIVKIVGSYTNIVGLPLYETAALLSGEGFPIHFGWLNAV